MQTLVTFVFKLLAALSLAWLHKLGNLLGSLGSRVLSKDRQRVFENMKLAGLNPTDKAVKKVFREMARGGLELPMASFRRPEEIENPFVSVNGWEHVQTALSAGEGLLFITPYIGSYDLVGRYISQQLPFPLTAMYKLPKIKVFDAVIQAGRVRGKGKTAPTSIQGVKQTIKALRGGEAAIVLPGHVPPPEEGGDGVWVDFFGKPVYTMALASKLARIKGVKALFSCGERLPDGKGFILHTEPLRGELSGDKENGARMISENTEYWIRHFPEQYLFMYNRCKHPEGAPFPPPEVQACRM